MIAIDKTKYPNAWDHCSTFDEHCFTVDRHFYRGTYMGECEGDPISINHGVCFYLPKLNDKVEINVCVDQNDNDRDLYSVYLDNLKNDDSKIRIDLIGISNLLMDTDDTNWYLTNSNCFANKYGEKYMPFEEARDVARTLIYTLIAIDPTQISKYITEVPKKEVIKKTVSYGQTNQERLLDKFKNKKSLAEVLYETEDPCQYCSNHGKDCDILENTKCIPAIQEWLGKDAETKGEKAFKKIGYGYQNKDLEGSLVFSKYDFLNGNEIYRIIINIKHHNFFKLSFYEDEKNKAVPITKDEMEAIQEIFNENM